MSDNYLILRELQESLLECLPGLQNSKSRSELTRKYLEDVNRLASVPKVSDFKEGLEWMNVESSLSFKSHLKGKIVLLDFFTYCCINCMHILPDLKFLEDIYKVENGFVVIGVHSPKFPNEKEATNVADAVKRYEISHPVVNDSEETMWMALGIRCWPTLVVVGPSGEVLLELLGEGHREVLKLFIGETLEFYKQKGLLSESPLPQIQQFFYTPQSHLQPLRYPGKVDVIDNLIAISDTGNHRVIVADLSGRVEHIVGGPESGYCDGSFHTARFNSLQGVAFHSNTVLYVADTKNHAIRKVDLKRYEVTTVAGINPQDVEKCGGKIQLTNLNKQQGTTPLCSPWDISIVNDVIFIAMAGKHQIWALFLAEAELWKHHPTLKKVFKKGQCVAVAGNGREENRNNCYPMSAGFAQPSGLCYSKPLDCVFIADSESSAIRRLNLNDGAVVRTMGGHVDPRNLFAFGDVDGGSGDVKLQHPLCVAWSDLNETLYVADTYNHKIKCMKPISEKFNTTLLDADNKPFKFNEPSGLSVHANNLYVADTNNHQIVVIDLETKSRDILNLQLPTKEDIKSIVATKTATLPKEGGTITINTRVKLSEGISLTNGAPSKWIVNLPKELNCVVQDGSIEIENSNFTTSKEWIIKVEEFDFRNVLPTIIIDCNLFYCVKDVCSSQKFSFKIPIEEAPLGSSRNVRCEFSHVIS